MKTMPLILAAIMSLNAAAAANDDRDFQSLTISAQTNAAPQENTPGNPGNVVIGPPQAAPDNDSADTMAKRLRDPSRSVLWKPRWHSSGIHGVRLPDIRLCPDKSLLAILESTGESASPSGSRLILLRTDDWQVARMIEFHDRHITAIRFLLNNDNILCLSEKQEEPRPAPPRLLMINPLSGKTLASQSVPHGELNALAVTSRFVFLKPAENSAILRYEIAENSLTPASTLECPPGETRFDVANDKRTLAIANKGGILIHDSANDVTSAKLELPANFQPAALRFLGGADRIAVVPDTGKGFVFNHGLKHELEDSSSGLLAFSQDDDTLYMSVVKNAMVIPVKIPDMGKGKPFTPTGMKPKTSGHVIFMDALPGNQVIAVSSMGYLMEFRLSGKRWIKNIILKP